MPHRTTFGSHLYRPYDSGVMRIPFFREAEAGGEGFRPVSCHGFRCGRSSWLLRPKK